MQLSELLGLVILCMMLVAMGFILGYAIAFSNCQREIRKLYHELRLNNEAMNKASAIIHSLENIRKQYIQSLKD